MVCDELEQRVRSKQSTRAILVTLPEMLVRIIYSLPIVFDEKNAKKQW